MIYAWLSPEQRQIIDHDLSYSDDDLTALDKVQSVAFAGLRLLLPESDKWLVSTRRGIIAQIEQIAADAGLIYWLAISNGQCEIKKTMVLKHP